MSTGEASDGCERDLARWLSRQEQLNPAHIDLSLQRLRPVARRLGLARIGCPLISVAGTNGKGSTVAFLEALALAHGLHVGTYGSPHLLHYGECVRIDGNASDAVSLMASFEAVEAVRDGVPLTAFEFRTLAAIHQLRSSRPALMVLEVGLGGRLDAVNVLDADVAVISAVGLDHQQWLGGTLGQVAREKSGIARPGRALVCAHRQSIELVGENAQRIGARLWGPGHGLEVQLGGREWSLILDGRCLGPLPLPALEGAHQIDNAAGAIAAFALAMGSGYPQVELLAHALSRVHLRGRLEQVRTRPVCVVDVAHNPQACAALAQWLRARGDVRTWRGVCAMYQDKDARGCLAPLAPLIDRWLLAGLPPPRGGTAERLRQAVGEVASGAAPGCFADVERAWYAGLEGLEPDAGLIGFGSFETVRRILALESAGA